jgi:hypothetical protein
VSVFSAGAKISAARVLGKCGSWFAAELLPQHHANNQIKISGTACGHRACLLSVEPRDLDVGEVVIQWRLRAGERRTAQASIMGPRATGRLASSCPTRAVDRQNSSGKNPRAWAESNERNRTKEVRSSLRLDYITTAEYARTQLDRSSGPQACHHLALQPSQRSPIPSLDR